jgi:hypothetical protein
MPGLKGPCQNELIAQRGGHLILSVLSIDVSFQTGYCELPSWSRYTGQDLHRRSDDRDE